MSELYLFEGLCKKPEIGILVLVVFSCLIVLQIGGVSFMSNRSITLYRLTYILALIIGPAIDIFAIWLFVASDFHIMIIAAYVFGGAALLGGGLWLWVSEHRILGR